MLLVGICSVAVGAATTDDGVIRGTHLLLSNEQGQTVARLSVGDQGNRVLRLDTKVGTELIFAGSDNFGNGIFTVNETTGTKMVAMGSRSGSGFYFHGYNMTGQDVVQIYADSRGGGAVGVSNLAGEGRVFKGKPLPF